MENVIEVALKSALLIPIEAIDKTETGHYPG